MRIQRNGHPLSADELHIERLIIGLAKRLVLLTEFHTTETLQLDFNGLKQHIDNISDHKRLRWRDWTRFSSRQQQTMQLGGLVGEWQLNRVSSRVAQLLYLGQWLHVGKNASFGLGKYQITNL
ncbi:CRISPR system precrRNA processing endoribonuclease RAMP protein Cas6 [Testudinibacter sp. P80/BLE/0925]|uniref:CRISPR system precrRNA processing endoribonuclease RAMP protein Cas6 n=1 Tax=Testudinibacter sp. TW-1 TaxID=3417757 RepID=UPI003D364348